MRVVITGVDGAGRSCVVSERSLERSSLASDDAGAATTHFSGATIERLYSTATSAPPSVAAERAPALDVGSPDTTTWYLVDRAPGSASPFHHTDSLDFDVVLEGSVDLVLDDGPHRLEVGDGVVIPGVDHAWHAGPEGCRYLVLVMSTGPTT